MKWRLGRIWIAIETIDVDTADASDRIKEHRDLKEHLEDAAADAGAVLSRGRAYLNDVSTIAAYAKDMKDFLEETRRGGLGGGHSVSRREASQGIERELDDLGREEPTRANSKPSVWCRVTSLR